MRRTHTTETARFELTEDDILKILGLNKLGYVRMSVDQASCGQRVYITVTFEYPEKEE